MTSSTATVSVGASGRARQPRVRRGWAGSTSTAMRPLPLLILHVALGVAMGRSSSVGTAHAVVVLVVAAAVVFGQRHLERLVLAASYIACSDVLWRTTGARFSWEGAKYVAGGLLLVAVVRFVRAPVRAFLPLAYIGVLVPSVVLTVEALGISGAREVVSFNLSGPFSLAASALLFLQIRLAWSEFERVLLAALLPLTTLLAFVTYQTTRSSNLTFGTESNFDTSGGFGPNQVSTVLCLGALLCLILVFRKPNLRLQVTFVVLGLWFFGQGAFTFSRGGVFNLAVGAGALLLGGLFVARDRMRIMLVVAAVVAGAFVIFGWLDAFTGGALEARFSETGTTGRAELVASDFDLLRENPFAGVGPGMSANLREGRLYGAVAHTEFTRLLSEHGALGVGAIMALFAMLLVALSRAPNGLSRAISLALILWAVASMTNAAMRTGAVGFMFGLGMARIAVPRREEIPG